MNIIIRTASENSLKSEKVRKIFMRRMVQNMQAALAQHRLSAKFDSGRGRIFAEISDASAIPVLQRVFGVHSVSPIDGSCAPVLAEMLETVAQLYKEQIKGKTFAVRVSRADIDSFTSVQAERALGAALYEHAASRVDLKNPEFPVFVEVRREGAFFYTQRMPGPCGLPTGVQGRGLALISGGFDSMVAAWYMLKRGIEVDFLYCNLSGMASERSVLRVCKAFCESWAFGYRPRMYVANFQPILKEMEERLDQRYAQVILKRMMLRVANKLAIPLRSQVLITGEVVGQVSSQTLNNLVAIDAVTNLPVFRPIIGFDKDEIVKKSREIGMFQWSMPIRETCGLVKLHPVTHATSESADLAEQNFDFPIVDDVADSAVKYEISSLNIDDLDSDFLFTRTLPKGCELIDTRDAKICAEQAFGGARNIELGLLREKFRTLDKEQTYVLLCTFGEQSAQVAELMQNNGYDAYAFLGGTKAYQEHLATTM